MKDPDDAFAGEPLLGEVNVVSPAGPKRPVEPPPLFSIPDQCYPNEQIYTVLPPEWLEYLDDNSYEHSMRWVRLPDPSKPPLVMAIKAKFWELTAALVDTTKQESYDLSDFDLGCFRRFLSRDASWIYEITRSNCDLGEQVQGLVRDVLSSTRAMLELPSLLPNGEVDIKAVASKLKAVTNIKSVLGGVEFVNRNMAFGLSKPVALPDMHKSSLVSTDDFDSDFVPPAEGEKEANPLVVELK